MDSTDVRREWAERDGEFSPAYYAHYGPNETSEAIRQVLARVLDRDAAILEIGCSSGRHLAHLYDDGFEAVSGVEINRDAFEVMAEAYPDLAAGGTFYRDAIERVIRDFEDGQFDAVYTVQTLQHIHPDAEWVFSEIARITDAVLLTVENEGDAGESEEAASTTFDVTTASGDFPLYRRNWNRIFTELGFAAVDSRAIDDDTMRTFRRR